MKTTVNEAVAGGSGAARRGWFGPGLIMAASGIGASDIVTATVGGATYGRTLLWALLLGVVFKFVLSEGIARWQLATGCTVQEGWARYLPRWVLWVFACYLVLWSVAVSGALVGACGLALENVSGGVVPRSWGGFAQALIAYGLLLSVGPDGFSRVMKFIVVSMFVAIVVCAAVSFREPATAFKGLFGPVIPQGAGAYVLSLIGGVGGSLTLLSYNYLAPVEVDRSPGSLRAVRLDLGLAYLFTAIFGLSVMLIADRVFFSCAVTVSDRDAISRMAGQLAQLLGPMGFYVYSLGFWAAVLASVFGVWQTIPKVFADCVCLLRGVPAHERTAALESRSALCRVGLGFLALAAAALAFLGRPLAVIVAFTVLGSLFVPFLAGTLLYLNNAVRWDSPVPRNRTLSNGLLLVILLVFLFVGFLEIQALWSR